MASYNSSKSTEKKQWRSLYLIGGGVLLLVMLVLMMTSKTSVSSNIVRGSEIKTPLRTMTNEETWRAKSEQVLSEMQKSILTLKQKAKAGRDQLDALRKELKTKNLQLLQVQKRAARAITKKNTFSVLKPPINFSPNNKSTLSKRQAAVSADMKSTQNYNSTRAINFQSLEIVEDTIDLPVTKVIQKNLAKKTVKNYMPAGTFIEGILLSGLDAPSGVQTSGNPVPALIQITDYGMLPNDWRKDIKKCRVTVEGYGDLASERAYLRTLFLSCVKHNGEVIEVALKAYISGEDGKTGLRGKVVSKQGRMIAKSIWAGTIAGLGGALTNRYTTTLNSPLGSVTTVDGRNSLKQGLSGGVGKALDRVANYYLKQAERVYPVIEIGAGRKVTIILQKGVWLNKNKHTRVSRAAGKPIPQRTPPPRSGKFYRTSNSNSNSNNNTSYSQRRQ
ncbi:IncF plasmid conjugative transfer pilus assembly protein TraB [hydrothermal vent metagenome]|uniref:IncF plasmid conjugative transfer pilus assembly protein TraB n=1 Tax=hydrothermal vent metagenome TaxID=652676 RepID=A0A3B0YQ07_9ZZZZ